MRGGWIHAFASPQRVFVTITAGWCVLLTTAAVCFVLVRDANTPEDCDCPEPDESSVRSMMWMLSAIVSGGALTAGLYSAFAQHRKLSWVEANVSEDTPCVLVSTKPLGNARQFFRDPRASLCVRLPDRTVAIQAMFRDVEYFDPTQCRQIEAHLKPERSPMLTMYSFFHITFRVASIEVFEDGDGAAVLYRGKPNMKQDQSLPIWLERYDTVDEARDRATHFAG